MTIRTTAWLALVLAAIAATAAPVSAASCRDNVVLVHGNAGYPSHFDNTYNELLSRGYTPSQIWRPNWGSKTCPACNDHDGAEEIPVREALLEAIALSCTGRIDVIGHSMGVTLAARQIIDHGLAAHVDAFVGIAAAYRGLWSCGAYPFNVQTSTCGVWGLSVNSPFLNSIFGQPLGSRVYSIYSWQDQVICSTGVCTVGGVHSSRIENASAHYAFPLGHFNLLLYTPVSQVNLIQ